MWFALEHLPRRGVRAARCWVRAALDVGWGAQLGAAAPGEGQGLIMAQAFRYSHGFSGRKMLEFAPRGGLSVLIALAGTVGLGCCLQPCMGETCVGLGVLPTARGSKPFFTAWFLVRLFVFFCGEGEVLRYGFGLVLFVCFLGLKGFSTLLPL